MCAQFVCCEPSVGHEGFSCGFARGMSSRSDSMQGVLALSCYYRVLTLRFMLVALCFGSTK